MNKKIIQICLVILLIFISIIFYKTYFQKNSQTKSSEKNEEVFIENESNLIKNLRYNVNFDDNTKYLITAELSEIFYKDESEFVKMQLVTAKFTDQDNLALAIKSDNAIYDNNSYNTKFSKNVKITYLGNIITSEYLELNFEENIVTIQNNVVYEGIQGHLKSDNIVINLITKKTEIFMNDDKDKIKIESK